MFPLDDRNGRIVGFSGRIYTDSKLSKYMNMLLFTSALCLVLDFILCFHVPASPLSLSGKQAVCGALRPPALGASGLHVDTFPLPYQPALSF